MKRFLLATTFLSGIGFAAPTPASADPISLAVAALSTVSMGSAALSFTAFGLSLTGMGAAFAHFAIRAALGYALNALTPKPTVNSTAGRGYSINALGPALPHAIVYGEANVGGATFYQARTGTSNRYLHQCIAFAGHEVDSFVTLYLDDVEVTLDGSGNVTAPSQYVGYVRLKTHLGSPTQAADADLVSEVTEWTTAHQVKGVAYVYARYDYNATAFPNGRPTLTAVIKGAKVYDPRTSTTAWSDNPALCIRDYLTQDFGLGEASTEINDDLFATAADVCDETVASAKRYTCNGTFTLDAVPSDIISGLLSSMGGVFWYAQGQWSCKAAKYTAPTITLDEDDLRGEIGIATRNSRRDNFNTLHGLYVGAETDWQESDYPEVTDAAYVTEDGGVEVSSELPLLFTSTSVMAERIATIALKRNRQQLTVTAPFGLKAMQIGIGDTVMVTNSRAGFASKVFEVNDWRFALTGEMDLQANVLLREIDSSVFT